MDAELVEVFADVVQDEDELGVSGEEWQKVLERVRALLVHDDVW